MESSRQKGQQPSLLVMDCKPNLLVRLSDDDKDIPSFVRKGRIQAIINTVGTKRTADEDGEQIRQFSY